MLRRIAKAFIRKLFYLNKRDRLTSLWAVKDDDIFQKYCSFVEENRNIKYTVDFCELPLLKERHKWVGAQAIGDKVYAIPNDASGFLCYNAKNRQISFEGKLQEGLFKWTGGCVWNGNIYAFPRSSDMLLGFEPDTRQIRFYQTGQSYQAEHHYGGVCTEDGRIYQPPRDSDHILVWDLNLENSRKICLATAWCKLRLRYCGSIIHPNGFAYFFPERKGRVMKMDLQTEEWCLIGQMINTMTFDAKVAADGNIYGFSAYCAGIMKINVTTDSVEMIHTEVDAGAYGTKLGLNGKLYSIAGNGQFVWEYDPCLDEIKKLYDTKCIMQAKYAGGVTMQNGVIMAMPARGNELCMMMPDKELQDIPKDIYMRFWNDCY